MVEASATTVNIQGLVPTEMPTATVANTKHSHKPNWGKYVADCPACQAKYPDGPPKRAKKAKSSLAEENAILKRVIADLQKGPESAPVAIPSNATDELVRLMLAEQAEKIAEKQAEKARKAAAREQDLAAAREMVAQKEAREAACEASGHKKENGRSAIFQSQVHNDGFVHPFCSRCFKTFPRRRPTQEQMSTSVEG